MLNPCLPSAPHTCIWCIAFFSTAVSDATSFSADKPPFKKIGLNTVQTQVHSNKQWFPVGYSAKQPSVNVVRTHFHKDNSPCPPFPLKKSVSVGDMVSSTYLERRKLKMFEDEDGCTVVRFDGKHNKNVTFRNELRSLGLRILSPSTWTLMR